MLKSWFKFLSRNKFYTAVEALGLTVGLTFVILIGSYVWQQFGVLRENPDHKRIYAVHPASAMYLSYWDRELLLSLPEVEAASRIAYEKENLAQYGDRPYVVSCLRVDPDFFDIFPQYRIREGTAENLASGANALVSRSFAAKLDAGGGVLGHELTYDGNTYVITGIFEDLSNTLVRPADFIIDARIPVWERLARFSVIGTCVTLFRVTQGCDETLLREKVLAAFSEHFSPAMDLRMSSMREIYFSGNSMHLNHGNLSVLRLLTVVVLLLLFSALLNYVNLNLALTGRRAREMATRRLLGAGRGEVVLRGIAESVLFTGICFALALLLADALTPMMNRLLAESSQVELRFLLTPGYLLFYLGAVLLTGSLAGLMPALAVSNFSPLDVVRGTFTYRSKMVFSRIVIAVQHILAVVLLTWSCVMELQMKHMMQRPLGVDVSDLFYLFGELDRVEEAHPLEDRLRALSCVQEIGYGRGYPGGLNITIGYNAGDERNISLAAMLCDSTYFRMMGFSRVKDFGHPLTGAMWMSESAFAETEVSDTSASFARRFSMNGSRAEHIGGIVRDFPGADAASADGEQRANTVIIIDRPEKLSYSGMLIRTAGPHEEARRQIRAAWEDFETERIGTVREPWECGYIEDLNAQKLDSARNAMRLLEIFMALALLISLLGLVAMSTHFSRQGTREIAVRKVFGSDTRRETLRMLRSYLLTVFVSLAVGLPLAACAAGRWLEQFAYRIGSFGRVLPLVALALLLIDLGAILWQTLRAARMNPAEELKKE